jgi:hypothetical protein
VFRQHPEFGVEEACGGGETPMPGRSRSRLAVVAIEAPRLPYLPSETPDTRERVPKVVNQPAALFASTDWVPVDLMTPKTYSNSQYSQLTPVAMPK